MIAKVLLLLLLTVLGVNAEVTDTDAEIDVAARRARTRARIAPVCKCPPPNEDIVCKQTQQREKFLSDDHCKCEKYRCVWEVCPEVRDIKCKPCQVKVEVDDCGCKQFECQDKSPKHR